MAVFAAVAVAAGAIAVGSDSSNAEAGRGHGHGYRHVRQGVVYVTPDADSEVVDILDDRFWLLPVRYAHIRFPERWNIEVHGIVTSFEDLGNRKVRRIVQREYDSGHTVGLLDAGTHEAKALVDLVGRTYPAVVDDRVPLLALREDNTGDNLLSRTHMLQEPAADEDDDIADEAYEVVGDFLERVFQNRDDAGFPEPDPGDDPQNELTQLADSVLSHSQSTDKYGDALEVVNNIWATRSFTSSKVDYYYVQQTVTNTIKNPPGGAIFAISEIQNILKDPNTRPTIVQTSPGTTQNATTYTSGVSFGIGGNAGYSDGPVFGVAPSMQISNSTSTTVDSTQIANAADVTTGVTEWEYETDCGNNCFLNDKTYSYTGHFIWAVPFDAYGASQTSVTFQNLATTSYIGFPPPPPPIKFGFNSTIPLPFNQTELGTPTVSGVSTPTAEAGDTITVTGTNFYLIEGVLIGGHAVPTTNYNVVDSNTTLQIVVPSDQPTGRNQSIVVNTQEGLSDDTVTIHIES